MPFVTKKQLDQVSLFAMQRVQESRNTFFVPYTAKDFQGSAKNRQVEAALNAVLAVYGYDLLMVVGGVAAAAVFAGKGFIENSESAAESFDYSASILNATGSMVLHMNIDLLNFVSRILATAVAAVSSSAQAGVDSFYNAVGADVERLAQQCSM